MEANGDDVTFSEFIRFISEPGNGTVEQRNEHWLSIHDICNPCAIGYDIIGHFETLNEDADHVLKWMGATDVIKSFPKSDRVSNSTKHYDPKYFSQLSEKEVSSFLQKFMYDFLAFDYHLLDI